MVEKLSDWFPALNSHYHFLYYFSLRVESPKCSNFFNEFDFSKALEAGY